MTRARGVGRRTLEQEERFRHLSAYGRVLTPDELDEWGALEALAEEPYEGDEDEDEDEDEWCGEWDTGPTVGQHLADIEAFVASRAQWLTVTGWAPSIAPRDDSPWELPRRLAAIQRAIEERAARVAWERWSWRDHVPSEVIDEAGRLAWLSSRRAWLARKGGRMRARTDKVIAAQSGPWTLADAIRGCEAWAGLYVGEARETPYRPGSGAGGAL